MVLWHFLDGTTNPSESYKREMESNALERATIEGDSPVDKSFSLSRSCRVLRDTCNLVGIRDDHVPRLNTTQQPIVYKYREGKVKRTPIRGVK